MVLYAREPLLAFAFPPEIAVACYFIYMAYAQSASHLKIKICRNFGFVVTSSPVTGFST